MSSLTVPIPPDLSPACRAGNTDLETVPGSAVLGVAGFVVSILQLFVAVSSDESPDDRTQLTRACDTLADQVRDQWRREAATRSLHEPKPIELKWTTTNLPVSVSAESVAGSVVGGRPTKLKLRGELSNSVDKFLQLPRRQLAVLGEPGAGKTVFSLLVTLGLLERRTEDDLVPVLLPVASWNPLEEDLRRWIARRLAEDYPSLRRISLRTGEVPEQLVRKGLVLPILDGLDEIPEALRGPALREINGSLHGQPLIVTCRTAEYTEAVRTGGVLAHAAVVEILPVSVDDALKFLADGRLGDADRWKPLINAMRDHDEHDHLARALSTPLMISLARAVYRSPTSRPAELADRDRFADQASIEKHLLDRYIPTLFGTTVGTQASREWRLVKVSKWLTFLATHLTSYHTRDFAWWRLHAVLRQHTINSVFVGFVWITGVLVGSLVFGPLLGNPFLSPTGAIVGTACGATAVVTARFGSVPGPPVRIQIAQGRRTNLREMLRSAIVGGLAPGLLVIAAVSLITNVVMGILIGVIVFGIVGIAAGIPRWSAPVERAMAADPRSVLRADRNATIFLGSLGTALTAAFIYVSFAQKYEQRDVLLAAALGGVVLGFGFMLGTAWTWFHAVRIWLALQGKLPWRLMQFLDEAYRRGVLRRAGAIYQFRHGRLQDYLTSSATPPDSS